MNIFKEYFFLFLFGILSINLYSQYNFETGNSYHILQNEVAIRLEPNINSNVIAVLNINDEIELLENTNISEEINNTWSYWYKIRYGNILGYIFGGYLSINSFETNFLNGTNSNFYFRCTTKMNWYYIRDGIKYYGSTIDSHSDIFIYFNNQRINTNVLNRYWFNTHGSEFIPLRVTDESHFDWCEFEKNDNYILIRLYNYGRHNYVWTTTYKINVNGEISFYEWAEDDLYIIRRNENGGLEYIGDIGYWPGEKVMEMLNE